MFNTETNLLNRLILVNTRLVQPILYLQKKANVKKTTNFNFAKLNIKTIYKRVM